VCYTVLKIYHRTHSAITQGTEPDRTWEIVSYDTSVPELQTVKEVFRCKLCKFKA